MIAIISTSAAIYLYINIGPEVETPITRAVSNNNNSITPKINKTAEDLKEPDGEYTAYLTNIQNMNPGYYLSFDYVIFDTTAPGPAKLINDNPKIRQFMASPELMVGYDFTNSLNGNKFYKFEDYVKLLTKVGEHYQSLKIYDDSYQHGDLYSIEIKGGVVEKMYEVGDFTKPQGAE